MARSMALASTLMLTGPTLLRSAAAPLPANPADSLRSAVKSGELAFRLTTPSEFKVLMGAPEKERTERDGDRNVMIFEYAMAQATFARFGEATPYTLFELTVDGKALDIGKDSILTLRRIEDLSRLDTFWGMANVSLVKLDLSDQVRRLNQLPFDSRTRWPAPERLPKGFDPASLLEEGKNPGLGVRKLHDQGIDGRGIHIAIIDQPLLRDHREYKEGIVEYEEIDVQGVPAQMHGAPVTSIAVGKTCGTAPAAAVHYYAVPMWKWWNQHCEPYAATLEQVIQHNKKVPEAQKVRVVSISLGMFSQWPDRELWEKGVQHAAREGILVVTCDPAALCIAPLKRYPGQDPDSPASYINQFGFAAPGTLSVPAGNRATASYTGPNDYVFWRDGGMSWTVPYLAGVAAMAFQLNPKLSPDDIPHLWLETATKTPAGCVLNPPGFIDAARKTKTEHAPASQALHSRVVANMFKSDDQ